MITYCVTNLKEVTATLNALIDELRITLALVGLDEQLLHNRTHWLTRIV